MRPELLAPAGDLEKARIACLYGADSVYLGGNRLSLRARAAKLDLSGIREAALVAHGYKKKLFVTVNAVPHAEDLAGLDDYLVALDKANVDAIICSDAYVMERAKALTNLKIHISTQLSVANSRLVEHYLNQGASRIVLARELSLSEIALIRNKTKAELEVFIHGGMCVSYSGRCTLANAMSRRDANRGGCAHNCRWTYDLYKDGRLLADDFAFAAKDLGAIGQIPELIALGVDAFKIEGRMKSLHYIASVVKTYRMLIDDVFDKTTKPREYYQELLAKAENRPLGPGFLLGPAGLESQLYQDEPQTASQDFIGVVRGYDQQHQELLVEQRNHFRPGELIEVLRPRKETLRFIVGAIRSESGAILDAARHPQENLRIPLGIPLEPYDLLRRVSS